MFIKFILIFFMSFYPILSSSVLYVSINNALLLQTPGLKKGEKLKLGKPVIKIGENTHYYKVKTKKGKVGWILKKYLAKNPPDKKIKKFTSVELKITNWVTDVLN